MEDKQGRKIDYLRISLTDRCNLRCKYCMPEEGIPLINHKHILSYEEIIRIVKAGAKSGIKKVRLTGGEPLLRKDLPYLIGEINAIEGIEDIAITTNGYLLDAMLDDLVHAGLKRINLSLDTMDPDTFKSITGFDGLDRVVKGLHNAIAKGLKVKINAVPLKNYNDDDLVKLVELTKQYPIDVRFIELMPIGCGKQFTGISTDEIQEKLANEGLKLYAHEELQGNGPAVYYKLKDGKGAVGFISPMSHSFCTECNRVRITPEGFLKLCLHAKNGVNLRDLLRDGISDGDLLEVLRNAIWSKPEKHHFDLTNHEDEDTRNMNQIGG